jgi:lysocardiolipin and lysophospholipid acyltransferase
MNTTMTTDGLKQRHPPNSVPVIEKLKQERTKGATEKTPHPAGEIKHGFISQAIRMSLFALYFNSSILAWVFTIC